MRIKCTTQGGLSRMALAAAIAIALSGPAYAAESERATRNYDSAVTYANYRGQEGNYKLRATDLIGRDIRNAADDEIGQIDDLIVSRDGDKVMAIMSVGGFFGLGTKLVAVPYEDLRVTKDGKHVYYDATKDQLEARSEFTYGDGEQSASAAGVEGRRSGLIANDDREQSATDTSSRAGDRAAANEAMPADNSAHNERDADGEELTPLDQSHANADVEITRAIRKMLVDDDTLGTDARNVKVITVDGMVTLRGAVENADEQARIVAIAKEAAGLDRVSNELQVTKR